MFSPASPLATSNNSVLAPNRKRLSPTPRKFTICTPGGASVRDALMQAHRANREILSRVVTLRRKKKKEKKPFIAMTQCHANILNLPQAQGKMKFFWMFIVVLAAVGLSYTLLHVLTRYIKSPKASEIMVESVEGLPFPAIVICSLNPLNRTFLKAQNISYELAYYAQNIYATMKNDAKRLNENRTVVASLDAQIQELSKKYENQDLRQFFFEAGYNCEAFLQACAFQWESFSCCEHAKHVFDVQFGKCFLIENGEFTQHYPAAGLQVKIRVEKKTAAPQFGPPSRGIALRILPTYDASATESTYLGMGVHAAVQIDEFHQNYLNTFFKTICNPHKNAPGLYWSSLTTSDYTQNQCIGVCFNQVALELCNCTYPQDIKLFDRLNKPRICAPTEVQHCLIPFVEKNQNAHNCARRCLPECHQIQYRASVSTADLAEPPWHLNDDDPEVSNVSLDETIVLDVFFAKIQRTQVREVYIVTADGLISQVGGLLGIFLGASLITAVQLIMYWCSLCYNCTNKYKSKRRAERRRKKINNPLVNGNGVTCTSGSTEAIRTTSINIEITNEDQFDS